MGKESKDSKFKQWHPMFLKSMRLALADAKPGQIEIQKEVPLSSKPLEIDIIVVKHNDDKKLRHPIAGIFRKWNIIEFKSPSDYLAPSDFDTALVYARWHQVLENPKENLLDKYTVTYVSSTFPRAMVKRLQERCLVIKENLPVPGIYRVEGEMYPIQDTGKPTSVGGWLNMLKFAKVLKYSKHAFPVNHIARLNRASSIACIHKLLTQLSQDES